MGGAKGVSGLILSALWRCRSDGEYGSHRREALAAPGRSPCLDHLGSEEALFTCVWEVISRGSRGEAVRVFIDVGTHEATEFWRHVEEDENVWVIGFEPTLAFLGPVGVGGGVRA